jgi:hypothetical protein
MRDTTDTQIATEPTATAWSTRTMVVAALVTLALGVGAGAAIGAASGGASGGTAGHGRGFSGRPPGQGQGGAWPGGTGQAPDPATVPGRGRAGAGVMPSPPSTGADGLSDDGSTVVI